MAASSLLLLLVLPLLAAAASSVLALSSTPSSPSRTQSIPPCPIDFRYLNDFPWVVQLCQTYPASLQNSQCCQALLNTLGIGLAQYLRASGFFELPDNATAYSCLQVYQTQLEHKGLTIQLPGECFPDISILIRSPLLCSGIETATDWKQKVGFTAMDISCKGDLSQPTACQICNNDAADALTKANNLSNNTASCFYFTILYAAGVINSFGPENPDTAYCLLAVESQTARSKHHHVIVYICVGIALALVASCIAAILFYIRSRRNQQMVHKKFIRRNATILAGSLQPNTGAIWFRYGDIKAATNNFSDSNLAGIGGFASVYKGVMADGLQIAVKKIKNCTAEGDAEFLNEVEVINKMRHRNLVVLRGCCIASNTKDGHQRLLVYDYMCNGSLEDYLFGGRKPPLTWPQRRKIAIGITKGLDYLHNGVQPSIIHRDIKANNVLLDAQLNVKLADFGLAKIQEEGMTHLTTRVAGTQGYLAPEYALYGQVTEKSDVYSFGVLLLVLMSGRLALDTTLESPSHFLITDWAWMMVKEGKLNKVIDARIRNEGPQEIMERFVLVGILCAHLLVAFRPTIGQALKMLEGDEDIPEIPDRPLPLNFPESLNYLFDDIYRCSSMTNSEVQFSFNSANMLR